MYGTCWKSTMGVSSDKCQKIFYPRFIFLLFFKRIYARYKAVICLCQMVLQLWGIENNTPRTDLNFVQIETAPLTCHKLTGMPIRRAFWERPEVFLSGILFILFFPDMISVRQNTRTAQRSRVSVRFASTQGTCTCVTRTKDVWRPHCTCPAQCHWRPCAVSSRTGETPSFSEFPIRPVVLSTCLCRRSTLFTLLDPCESHITMPIVYHPAVRSFTMFYFFFYFSFRTYALGNPDTPRRDRFPECSHDAGVLCAQQTK